MKKKTVTIEWRGKQMVCKRIVLGFGMPEREKIQHQAKKLGLPVTVGMPNMACEGDFWVGISPRAGFGKLAQKTMEASFSDSAMFLRQLMNAVVKHK